MLSVGTVVRTPRKRADGSKATSGDVETWQSPPPPDPKAELSSLPELFAAGDEGPLPPLPGVRRSILRPCRTAHPQVTTERALGEWEGTTGFRARRADPAMALCFGAGEAASAQRRIRRPAGRGFGPARANSGKGSV